MTTAIEKPGLVYQAISAIMSEIPSIGKGRKNEAQHYSFRGIDDIYLAVNPILTKHRVFMRSEVVSIKREERPSKSGGIMAFVMVSVRYYFVASDGSSVSTEVVGEGMDSGDKASAKAMSIAQKYAILQMFCIPTSEPKDIEDDDPDPAPRRTAAPEDDDPFAQSECAEDHVKGKKKPAPQDPEGPALASLEKFAKVMSDLKSLGIAEEAFWTGIHRFTAETFKKAIVEVSGFTTAELDLVNGYLHRRKKATEADRAKKAKDNE